MSNAPALGLHQHLVAPDQDRLCAFPPPVRQKFGRSLHQISTQAAQPGESPARYLREPAAEKPSLLLPDANPPKTDHSAFD